MSEQKPERDVKIQDNKLKEAEFCVGRFDAQTEVGTTKEDLLRQDYWSHVSKRLVPFSEIAARCDDGSYYAKLLVLDCGPGWAKVFLLNWWNLEDPQLAVDQTPAGLAADYEIVWKGPKMKHVVIRKTDQQLMHEGEQRKAGAEEWLKEHLTTKVHKQPQDLAA